VKEGCPNTDILELSTIIILWDENNIIEDNISNPTLHILSAFKI
jgi:hypothetical protein